MMLCRYFAASVGTGWVITVVVALLAMQAARTSTDAYVTLWSSEQHDQAYMEGVQSCAATTGSEQVGGRVHQPQHGSYGRHQRFARSVQGKHHHRTPGEHKKHSGAAASRRFLRGLLALTLTAVAATCLRSFSFAFAGLRGARRVHRELLQACALTFCCDHCRTPPSCKHGSVHAPPPALYPSTTGRRTRVCCKESQFQTHLPCRVMGMPVALLTRIPQGRLLARFSSDTATIDDQLPFTANILLANIFSFAAAVAVMLFSQPLLLLLLVPAACVFQRIQLQYRCVDHCQSDMLACAGRP
jgi:ABC transporter transmembrane region